MNSMAKLNVNKNNQTEKKVKLLKLRREKGIGCLTCEFKDGCSARMCMASLIFNWKLVEAESRILIQSSKQRERQFQNLSGA